MKYACEKRVHYERLLAVIGNIKDATLGKIRGQEAILDCNRLAIQIRTVTMSGD